MSWIVVRPKGAPWDVEHYLRRVRASVGRMKYLQETLVQQRSQASRFKSKEAAEDAAGWIPLETRVEEY